jgi:hypothetical protein
MTYTELLNQMIEDSGLSANEICRRCQADGVDLKSTYLSALRNDPTRRASDEISRAIAKACGKPEDWLVTQARLDEDTEILEKMRTNLRDMTVVALGTFLRMLGYPELEEKAKEALNEMPEIEFLAEASSMDVSLFPDLLEEVIADPSLTSLLKKLGVVELFVQDDAMAPMLPKGGRVHVEVCEYKDGDILCYQKQGDNTCYIRQARFLDSAHNEVVMIPHNSGYPTETVRLDELSIYGKVKQLIVDFE